MPKLRQIYLLGQEPVLIVKRKKRKPGEDRPVLVEFVNQERLWKLDASLVKFVCPRMKIKEKK